MKQLDTILNGNAKHTDAMRASSTLSKRLSNGTIGTTKSTPNINTVGPEQKPRENVEWPISKKVFGPGDASNRRSKAMHRGKSQPVPQRRFVCYLCSAQISRLDELRMHLARIHLKPKSLHHCQCGRVFKTKINLQDHSYHCPQMEE